MVNYLIHEGYGQTKGAQTAQGYIMFGACFATLTFPWVQAARGDSGQHHLIPTYPPLSCPGGTEQGQAGREGSGPSVPYGGRDPAPGLPAWCRQSLSWASNRSDTGTWGLPGDFGTAPSVPKSSRAAARPPGPIFNPRCPTPALRRELPATSPSVPQDLVPSLVPSLVPLYM